LCFWLLAGRERALPWWGYSGGGLFFIIHLLQAGNRGLFLYFPKPESVVARRPLPPIAPPRMRGSPLCFLNASRRGPRMRGSPPVLPQRMRGAVLRPIIATAVPPGVLGVIDELSPPTWHAWFAPVLPPYTRAGAPILLTRETAQTQNHWGGWLVVGWGGRGVRSARPFLLPQQRRLPRQPLTSPAAVAIFRPRAIFRPQPRVRQKIGHDFLKHNSPAPTARPFSRDRKISRFSSFPQDLDHSA